MSLSAPLLSKVLFAVYSHSKVKSFYRPPFHSVVALFTDHLYKPTLWKDAAPISKNSFIKHFKESPIFSHPARQDVLEPHTQRYILVAASTSKIHTVKREAMKKSMKMIIALYGVIGTPPLQLFHVLLCSFSAEAMHQPKRMVRPYAKNPPTTAMTPKSSQNKQLSMGTPRERIFQHTAKPVLLKVALIPPMA